MRPGHGLHRRRGGIPFSDPLADGPTIQRTGQVALGNGMTLTTALGQVRDARAAGVTIPLAVMTYVNPVLSFGLDAFARSAAGAGVDGVIVPDLPLDEAAGFREAMHAAGVAVIPLVAPTTTPERLARICCERSRIRLLRRRHRSDRRAAHRRR